MKRFRDYAKEINLILTLKEFDYLHQAMKPNDDEDTLPNLKTWASIYEKLSEIKKRLDTTIPPSQGSPKPGTYDGRN